MATSTYLDITNRILRELNEVVLTSSTFSGATNIQGYVKDLVNKVYIELCEYNDGRWPWLSTGANTDPFLGNTTVTVSEGVRWYLLKTGSSGYNDDFGVVDWENFILTNQGVSGEEAPYVYNRLAYYNLDEWQDFRSERELQDASNTDSQVYGEPDGVIRSPDGRYFGLTPIPKQEYKVYFWAWDQPTRLSAYDDVFPFKEEFIPVIEAGVRYYVWQFKENSQQSGMAMKEWKDGKERMKRNLLSKKPDRATDDRIWWP